MSDPSARAIAGRLFIGRGEAPLHAAFLIVALLSAWHFTELRFAFNLPYDAQSSIKAMLAYEADRPFQYRILVPFLANAIPATLIELPRNRFFAIELLASLGTIFAFRGWLGCFFPSVAGRSLLSLLILPCMLFNFVLPRETPLWFPWDIPSVMVFALGLMLLRQRRWWLFYPLFVLGTLNRETTCFLTMILFLGHWEDRGRREYWLHLAVQTSIWLGLKAALAWTFRDHGGQLAYNHMAYNWALLLRPSTYPLLLSSMGFTMILAGLGWSWVRDPFVRRSLLVLIPFHGGLFLVGRLLETRIYGELIPLTLCATMLIAANVLAERGGAGSGSAASTGE